VGVVIVFMSLGLIMGRMQTEFAAMLATLRHAIRLLG
jgi:flagellar biosynthesis protein FliR